MPDFTYLPDPEDPETVSTHGFSFTAGEWTPIPDDHAALAKLRGNRFFAERDMATNGNISPGDDPPADPEQSSAEQHESGGADGNMPIGGVTPERQRPNNGPAVEITPLQCRAARAGLEWSREHLAELAGMAH
jgi:hypothetical protein